MKQIRANNKTPSWEVRAQLPQCKTCTCLMFGCWCWPTFSGQCVCAGDCLQICAEMASTSTTNSSTTATRSRLGGVPARAALDWRVGLARGERPEPDSANLSLLSGAGRPAHPSLHHGRTASLASEPGHCGRAEHLPEQQPAQPHPCSPPPSSPSSTCLLQLHQGTGSYSERMEDGRSEVTMLVMFDTKPQFWLISACAVCLCKTQLFVRLGRENVEAAGRVSMADKTCCFAAKNPGREQARKRF